MTVNFGNAPNDSDDIQDLWYALREIGAIDPEGDRIGGSNPDLDALVVTVFERNSMYNGNLFTAGSFIENVADGASSFLYVENPSDSNTLIDAQALTIRTGGKAILTVTQDPTVDSAGGSASIRNKRTASSDTSVATIQSGGQYSGGVEEEDILIPAGEGSQKIGGETADRLALIDQGDALLFEIQNDSGRTIDQEIKVKFSEVPV